MHQSDCTLIIGISSGIGSALSSHLHSLGDTIVGTVRSKESSFPDDCKTYHLDLSCLDSIENFVDIFSASHKWRRLIFCPAVMSPIGPFDSVNITDWLNTFNINCLNR